MVTAQSGRERQAAELDGVPPSNTVPLSGVTLTRMEGGGGGGGFPELAPPPPQLRRVAPVARRTKTIAMRRKNEESLNNVSISKRVCGRGRIYFAIAGAGPAKERVNSTNNQWVRREHRPANDFKSNHLHDPFRESN